ncbi:hypothetical protein AGMMS50267_10840 [Spirochaetia bacterium]|nr:hypothetical protein AGMMS50267_10840 [Spirochaetia bacterium]
MEEEEESPPDEKTGRLQAGFSKLPEEYQAYILGQADVLTKFQGRLAGSPDGRIAETDKR